MCHSRVACLSRHPSDAARVVPALALLAVLAGCAIGEERDVVTLHGAYGHAGADVLVEGRVGELGAFAEATASDAPRLNFRRNSALFVAEPCDECPVELALGDASALDTETDEAGFFRAELAAAAPEESGWRPLVASSEGATRRGEALLVPVENRVGIVSDIDDTVLVTEVADSFRMLGNTFLRNPLQREAVPAMAALLRAGARRNPSPEAAPMFYLSSSPRELHDYLTAFLQSNDFPRGVLLTRRLTLDRQGYRLLDSVRYKTDRLVEILRTSAGRALRAGR